MKGEEKECEDVPSSSRSRQGRPGSLSPPSGAPWRTLGSPAETQPEEHAPCSVWVHTCIQEGRQTDRQTDRQAGRQTDRQTGRQTDRQANQQTDKQADRETCRHTKLKWRTLTTTAKQLVTDWH